VLRHNLSRAVRSPSSCGSHTCLTALALRFELRHRAKKPLTGRLIRRSTQIVLPHMARPTRGPPATSPPLLNAKDGVRVRNKPARGRKTTQRADEKTQRGGPARARTVH
jgi:hypothetical protein